MGWAVADLKDEKEGVKSLLDAIHEHIPAPDVKVDDDFRMLIT